MLGALIRDLPPGERPRERMFTHGAASLSVVELLALLLGSGAGRGHSALALAQELVIAVSRSATQRSDVGAGGIHGMTHGVEPAAALIGLSQASPAELLALPGLGPSKAARVLAGLELGRRLGQARVERETLGSPSDVYELLGDRMGHLDREHFVVLLLDTKNHLLGSELVSVGSLDASIVHPREVFKAAVRRSASGVILVHNHPSGDPSPSEADLRSTQRLEEAGRVLGIPVLDHVIIGDGRFVSLRQSGLAGDAQG